ncbi:MAG TPA: lysylphosphatidylglycerol synthase domain-containing protein [Vicinamibacterales bacterium]|nr:lysylphosphatidylglycerol synthase domain-containing protein [Vicinamibacterales bacterium]
MPWPPKREVRRWPSRRVTLSGMLIAVFALGLFVYTLWSTGADEIRRGLGQIGWGLPLIIAISGVRLLARTLAWRSLMRTPPPLGAMIGATLAGESVGNLLPLGPLAGEPAKVGYLRSRGPIAEAAAALGLENVFYSLSVASVIVIGMTLLVLTVALPGDLRAAATIALVAMAALVAAGVFVLLRRPSATGSILDRLPRWLPAGGLKSMESKAYGYYASAKGRLGPMLAFETLFHVFGLAEVYAVMWMLAGEAPSLLHAFILESAGRVINVLFRVVPMRVGVDESGSKLVALALGLADSTGVLLALARKVRVLFWTALGVALITKQGMSLAQINKS